MVFLIFFYIINFLKIGDEDEEEEEEEDGLEDDEG